MERTVVIRIFLLALSVSFQLYNSLAVPHDVQKRLRIERSNTKSYDLVTEETTVTASSPEVVCNASRSEGSDSERVRRFIANDSTTTQPAVTTTDAYSYLSDTFRNCIHIYVEPGCYEKKDDGSVFVPIYKKNFDRSNYFINEGLLFICPDFFPPSEEKFSEHISIISLVGSSISAVCLILHVIAYFGIRTAKNLPSRCLLSLCIALLCAYFFTFLQHAANDESSCRIVGMFMVYFFLASFFWMNVFSYDVWRSIRLATTKLRLTTDRPMMVRFARYSVYAWGSPLLIVISSIIVHHSTSKDEYKLIFNRNICWFQHRQALTLYFAGPLFTILAINILFTAFSFCMIPNTTMKGKMGGNGNTDTFDIRARFCLSLRLGTSMGLTWVFGVLAIFTKQEWLWYLFAICSALQGVFIFFSFTVSERSRKECRKALQSKKCSVMPTQTSSQQATSF